MAGKKGFVEVLIFLFFVALAVVFFFMFFKKPHIPDYIDFQPIAQKPSQPVEEGITPIFYDKYGNVIKMVYPLEVVPRYTVPIDAVYISFNVTVRNVGELQATSFTIEPLSNGVRDYSGTVYGSLRNSYAYSSSGSVVLTNPPSFQNIPVNGYAVWDSSGGICDAGESTPIDKCVISLDNFMDCEYGCIFGVNITGTFWYGNKSNSEEKGMRIDLTIRQSKGGLVIDGRTVELCEDNKYDYVIVRNNGILSVCPYNAGIGGWVNLYAINNITVDSTSKIDGDLVGSNSGYCINSPYNQYPCGNGEHGGDSPGPCSGGGSAYEPFRCQGNDYFRCAGVGGNAGDVVGNMTTRDTTAMMGRSAGYGGTGGAGYWDACGQPGSGGSTGQLGGAGIRLKSSLIKINGQVLANGGSGGSGGSGGCAPCGTGSAGGGGGGGGAGGGGGVIMIDADVVDVSNAIIQSKGGLGRSGGGGASGFPCLVGCAVPGNNGGSGQNGVGGRLKIFYSTLNSQNIQTDVSGSTVGTVYYQYVQPVSENLIMQDCSGRNIWNETFTGNENKNLCLKVPKNSQVTYAKMDLRGYGYGMRQQSPSDRAFVSSGNGGSCIDYQTQAANDTDTSTYGSYWASVPASYSRYCTATWTINNIQSSYTEFYHRWGMWTNGFCSSGDSGYYIFNYTKNGWDTLPTTWCGAWDKCWNNITLMGDYVSGGQLRYQTRANCLSAGGGGASKTNAVYYIAVGYLSYPSNPYIDVSVDGDNEWSYIGSFDALSTASNLQNEINSYLATCTADLFGNCDVPVKLHSDSGGIVEVSGIQVYYK